MRGRARGRISVAVAIVAASLSLSVGHASASTHRARPWYAPLLALPHRDLLIAECVMRRESHSTFTFANIADDNGNGIHENHDQGQQSGIFQMSNGPRGVWDLYARPVLHVVIWKATAYQQAEGFMLVWHADGWGPWHAFDGC